MASKKTTDSKKSSKKPIKKSSKKSDKQVMVPTLKSGVLRNFRIFRTHWKPLARATSVYAVLYFLFIRVLTEVDIRELNATVTEVFGGGEESILTRIISIGTLFGQSTSFDAQTGVLFFVITLVCSLAIVWILRSIWTKHQISVREAYYQGMYPLVPIVILVLVMFIQLVPFSIGAFLFQTAFDQGLAASAIEKLGFVTLLMAGIVLSGYWLIGSVMAAYIATVPGKAPFDSLDAAKMMLKGRRFAILRNAILFLVLTSVMILLPMLFIIWVWQDAAIVFAALLIVSILPWFHTYFYGLYRDLLNE